MVELEVLGPLVLRVDGENIRLGPVLRILLLGLFCARGGHVPASRLACLLSETGTPLCSPATLRSHVSHLRHALEGPVRTGNRQQLPVLVTDHVGGSAGYALRITPDRVDASRLERDVAAGLAELHAGRFSHASELLRSATGLWRGEPLADAANRAFAQVEIRRLESTYRAGLTARVQADVQRGMHGAVVGELEAMAVMWPDDGTVWVLLIICLYRCGRLAEAARACRTAVEAALAHGLDPRGLWALQRDVLTGSLPDTGLPHLPSAPKRILLVHLC